MKKRHDSNKENINKRKKISLNKHPETVKNYSLQYYKKNRNFLNQKSKDERLDPIKYLGKLVTASKRRAKEKLLNFDLDKDFIFQLYERQNKKCSVSGILFDFQKDAEFRIRPWAPSIDRIDSKLGYTKDNVRFVCVAVNLAINQFGDFIFDKMCKSYVNKSN